MERDDDESWAMAAELLSAGQEAKLRGDLTSAVALYERCRECARVMQDQDRAKAVDAAASNSLGNAYCSLGQIDTAIEHFMKALEISRALGDREGEGSKLGNLGTTYHSLGQYKRAIEHYTAALEISRAIGDQRSECSHLGNLVHRAV